MEEECHLWPNHMFDLTRKGRRTEQNKISSWRWQSSLSRQHRHTNRQLTHHQAANQQHHFHCGGKVHDHGHTGFLPKHPHGSIRVYEIDTLQHTGRHHRTLQTWWNCNSWWIHILQDTKGHVRTSTSGHNCPRTTCGPTGTSWLLPKQDNTRTMEAQLPSYHFLPPHQQFLK